MHDRRGAAKANTPLSITQRGVCSGDVLLSHNLSSHYHRGCSVSLPCSEWERVVPLRYYHQSAEPPWRFAAIAATQARGRISGHSKRTTDSLMSTYRKFSN